ncbi:MAG: hypothetical protein AAGD22_04430 [Verrucomicrobiota bacterium]
MVSDRLVCRFGATMILAAGLLWFSTAYGEESEVIIDVADASTHVNLARVNLKVGKMSFVDGKLVGNYAIDVPLMSSKSERGRIILPLIESVGVYAREGGTIKGEGIAEGKDEKPRQISVVFSPCDNEMQEGGIQLKIDTGARILEFESTYQLSGEDLLVLK